MPDHSPTHMRAFAIDFFSAFGAQIEYRAGDELTVHLSPELAAHFGKTPLYLTFRAVELSPFEDIVVYGSRVFEQMIAWLDGGDARSGRGLYAALHLPARYARPIDNDAPPPGLTWHNVSVESFSHSKISLYTVFNFRIVYTSDDRREELLTVVLDEQGEPHPELTEAYRDAVEPNELPRLASETLERLAERAVALVQTKARQRGAEIEAEQRARVERTLAQLRRFYEQRIAEVDEAEDEEDAAGQEERAALKAFLNEELARKLAEEVDRHRVRAEITPVNWATLTIPMQHYKLTLRRPNGVSQTLTVAHNLHSGALTPLLCHACGQPIVTLGLCDNGHLAGPECLHTCAVCGRDICTACGMVSDPIGGEWVCADCAVRCDACGQLFIPAHTAPCAACGRMHCRRDLRRCPVCGQQFCTAHMVKCGVCGELRCLNDARVCQAGGHPVCEQHYALCPVCGQGMCPDHTVTCTLCHQTACKACVDVRGVCRTCNDALHSAPVTWPDMPAQARGWTWRTAQNEHRRVYYGEQRFGRLVRRWIIAVAPDGRVLYHHQHTWIRSVLDWLRSEQPPWAS